MPLTILDSSVLIDVSRGRADASAYLHAAAEAGELWSVTPVRTELWAGARPDEIALIASLLGRLRWQDVTISIADLAGQYASRYRRTHHISFIDLALAAATTELEADLATLNIRHFPMFPDLQPPY
jgi:predicted nucleic acid-binding protein